MSTDMGSVPDPI